MTLVVGGWSIQWARPGVGTGGAGRGAGV